MPEAKKLKGGAKYLMIYCKPHLDFNYLAAAKKLILNSYAEANRILACLPPVCSLNNLLSEKIEHLWTNGQGVIAFIQGEPVGFLAGYPLDNLFGRNKGVYVPLFGHGASVKNQTAIYHKLYQAASSLWVEQSSFSHGITFFTSDTNLGQTWFHLGFGLRCIDAIYPLKTKTELSIKGYKVIKASNEDANLLLPLHSEHILYYRQAPLFMPNQLQNPLEELQNWLRQPNHHLWYLKENKEIIGYFRLASAGESFISQHPQVINITGAYLKTNNRQQGLGKLLLQTVINWSVDTGYQYLGVDFESFNLSGSSFWHKYFTPYTFSVFRRIDERIQLKL